ncbi:family 78 glycoside hydrolase catalytic domain [Aquipuribacter nitratireducens]|uniref:alpha-L-rhamnosidase n=1 Tax=Aquipuribacter nitratireducens TaxID=650104 RepID=A0ABW0GIY6_9MICO
MPAPSAPVDVRFDHLPAGRPALGIGSAEPRLSWKVLEAPSDYSQAAYEIELSRSGETATYVVESDEQVLIPWPAAPLSSGEAAEVRVRVRASDGDWSGWSDPASVEAGLLGVEDWSARFVSPAGAPAGGEGPAPVLVGRLTLPDGVVHARLRATAHGVYRAHVNGRHVGDEELAPGWTSYSHRLRYQTHDVTDLVSHGENVVEVLLGNGWYRGRLGFLGQRGLYGDRLALLLQLEVTTADGRVHVVGTDGSWGWRPSGVLADDLYDGEEQDLRIPLLGDPDADHGIVDVLDDTDAPLSRLVAPEGPPVRVTDELPAVEVFTSPSGRTLVDFGQNVVGRIRLRARGTSAGQRVVVRHAEVLEDGELGTRPLRTAKATDTYTCAGAGEEVLEPLLTFHGFRYAEVEGVDDLRPDDLTAVVLGSDLVRTGWFSSGHELLDRFHENVVWGMRGNFLDVPTDCPQRDERLGWTGDIQVFAPTASYLFDCAGFLSTWLQDLAADQLDDGGVPFVVPDVIRGEEAAAAAWGDAAAVVPTVLHERFADVDVLRRQLPSMRAWTDKLVSLTDESGLWQGGFQFGDWLDPTASPHAPFDAKADPDVVATAHLVRSAELTARAARLVGEDDVAAHYDDVAARTKAAFQKAYVTASGRVLSDAQTVYALVLCWDLLPTEEARRGAADRLADLVRGSGFRISTGFVGTPLVTDALTDTGYADLAFRLLLQTGCPSWLYSVTMGATTVWERWDSMLPDGTINPGEMTSFNHYALGAVADWLHRRVAGLAPAAPGYRRIAVRPVPTPHLDHVTARHETPYGPAEVAWRREAGTVHVRLEVPVGATADVTLTGGEPTRVRHGRHEWAVPDPCVDSAPTAPATVRDVLDDEHLWQRVVSAAQELDVVGDEAAAAARVRPYLGSSIHALAPALLGPMGIGEHGPLADRLRTILPAHADA